MNKPERKIILAEPRGFCAGVRRALSTVESALAAYGPPIYVRHEIVHNEYVVEELRKKGVVFVEDLREVPSGAPLIFSAHGVSPEVEAEAASLGLKVIDASCPLVKKIHHEAAKYHAGGHEVVLIGHEEHPEIIGVKGQIGGRAHVVACLADVAKLPDPCGRKVALLMQTTLSVDDTDEIVRAIRDRFGSLVSGGGKGICYATQNRQDTVKLLARSCDVVFVIGSKTSSNAARLKEVAGKSGTRAFLVNSSREVGEGMLRDAFKIGITAGASAPEILVNELVLHLESKGWKVEGTIGKAEKDVVFPLPGI